MIERQVVPEDLAELPPGPELAAVLASFDRSRLNGHDLVTLMRARARQIAHDQAQLLADMFDVAHSPAGDRDARVDRSRVIDEFAVDEIRMALRLTRRAADAILSLSMDAIQRLPQVQATLLAGEIDLPRARVLSQETIALPDQAARECIDQVLPAAPMLTTGQLAARIRSLVITVDPAAAQRRQERSVAERRVVTELDSDGTATLAGYRLPTDRAAAAGARVDAIARAARRSGDPRSIDQLRADTFLDLLEGIGVPLLTPSPVSPHFASSAGSHPAAAAHRPESSTGGTPVSTDDDCGPGCAGAGNVSPGNVSAGNVSAGSIELRVPLTTLMGLSEQPGELAGWGPVVAEIARAVAERNRRSAWRISVYDQRGRLVHHGPLRRRPTTSQAEFVKARDGTCRAPGCRVPASRADVDHTRQYAKGGPTTPSNLGLLCRHDHRLKDEGGWRLQQIPDGVFVWRSRLGHQYAVPPDPPFPPASPPGLRPDPPAGR